jgi:hypothetical protein
MKKGKVIEMQVWVLYADATDTRCVLGIYATQDLARKAWKEYLKKQQEGPDEEWNFYDWFVLEDEELAISEFKVIEDWNPEEIRDGL